MYGTGDSVRGTDGAVGAGTADGAAGAAGAAAIATVIARGLGKRYGYHRALAGVELTLRAGEMCALLGANGAGKSTLLGILSTLVRPTSGTVAYHTRGEMAGAGTPGRSLAGSALRRQIGVLAHSALVYGELCAGVTLAFFARLYEVADAAGRAAALLDEVGLDGEARKRPARTYSRGMLQRLALARTLLHRPSLLLLDEPFTGLDRGGASALARTLGGAAAARQVVLVVTHDLEAIAGVTRHVIVLRRGRMVHESRRDDPGQAGFSYDELKQLYHQHGE
jgi:heme exporter protein A